MKSGWQTKTLGEVLQKTETINPRQSPEAEFHYIDVSSVSNTTFQIEETQHLKGKDAPSRARRLVKANDVIFATVRPTLRRIAIVPEDLDNQICSTGYFILRPKAGVDHRFVFYWLFSDGFMSQMEVLQKGASYPAVTDSEVKAQTISIPPLPEQERIVGILDEAFEGIATAKANAEKNLQNAYAMFESHLQSVFSRRGDKWVNQTLGDIAQVRGGKRVPKGYKLLIDPTDYPYLRVTDFNDSGTIDIDDLHYVGPEVHREIKNYVIYASDLYISIAGTIGKTGIIPRELDGAHLTENACRLVFIPSVFNRFVYYFTLTPDFVEQAGLNTRTAAQPKLALSRLSTIKLGVPPLVLQQRLAAEFDALRDETQRLQSIYRRKLAALESLKKSLLHQAFTGAL
jgi:type I restriction enzyme S subunit